MLLQTYQKPLIALLWPGTLYMRLTITLNAQIIIVNSTITSRIKIQVLKIFEWLKNPLGRYALLNTLSHGTAAKVFMRVS